MIFLYIVITVLILLMMITIHEFGHYIAGKILKFKIDEFSIGFGPKLLQKKKKNGEVFTVRALPLGGYCAFDSGTDEEAAIDPIATGKKNNATDKGKDQSPTYIAFDRQKPWKRIIVFVSGAFANFLTAIIFSFIYILVVGYSVPVVSFIATDIVTDRPFAFELRIGDEIIAVNGVKIGVNDSFSVLCENVKENDTAVLTIIRDGKKREVEVTKQSISYISEDGRAVSGVMLGFTSEYKQVNADFVYSLINCVPFMLNLCLSVLISLFMLISGQLAISQLSGTIGTIATIAGYSQINPLNILLFLPLLACNLAVFNILPFPALDGSKVAFTSIEWVRKKPINKKIESAIHTAGIVFLMGAVLIIDIINAILYLI